MCTIQSLFSGGTYLACQAFLRWRLPNVFTRGPRLLVMSFVVRILKKTNSNLLKCSILTPPNESVFGSPLPLNWVLSNFWPLICFLSVYCTAHPPSTEKTWAELLQCTLGRRSQVDGGDKVQMGNSHWYRWKTATTSLGSTQLCSSLENQGLAHSDKIQKAKPTEASKRMIILFGLQQESV